MRKMRCLDKFLLNKSLGQQLILNRDSSINILFFSIPICLMMWTSGIWLCFIGFLVLYCQKYGLKLGSVIRRDYLSPSYLWVLIPYTAFFLLSIVSILFLKSPVKSITDACIFIVWLAISPIIAMLKLKRRAMGLGSLSAVFLALILTLIQFYVFDISRPYGLYGVGPMGSGAVKFGDMAILIGALSVFLLFDDNNKKIRILGFIGMLIGIIIAMYSQTRGGVLAILLCVLMWVLFFRRKRKMKISKKKVLIFISIFLISFLLNRMMNDHIYSAIQKTLQEVKISLEGRSDTAFGLRLQLWQSALYLFEEHPLMGVGLNNFKQSISVFAKQNLISELAASYAHAHNEYLCSLATGGIIGFIVTSLLFFLPLFIFKRKYSSCIWARCGFWCVCLESFFALTDCMFDRQMTVLALVIIVSIALAGIISQAREELASVHHNEGCFFAPSSRIPDRGRN
jgi:O-antigen ligase